jgi:hypothetical protein
VFGKPGAAVARPLPRPSSFPHAGEARPASSYAAHVMGEPECLVWARLRGCAAVLDHGWVNSGVNSVTLHEHRPLPASRRSPYLVGEFERFRRAVPWLVRSNGYEELDLTHNRTVSHSINTIRARSAHEHRRCITISGNPLSPTGGLSYDSSRRGVAKRSWSCISINERNFLSP